MKRIFFALFIAILSVPVSAQVNERFKKDPTKENKPQEQETKSEPKVVVDKSTEEPWYKKLRYGGSASASFGTNTAVYLAPNVGYQVSDKFMPGLGFIYFYQRTQVAYDPYTGNVYKLNTAYTNSMYGPAAFLNYYPLEFLQLSARGEYLSHDLVSYNSYTGERFEERVQTPVLFLGAAYYQRFENGGGFQIGIQYNVLYKGDGSDPYTSAWWPTIGFMF